MDIDYYKSKLTERRLLLERSKIMNEEAEKLQVRLDEKQALCVDLHNQIESLKRLRIEVSQESDKFRERRIGYLDDQITEVLAYIYPKEQLKAKIEYDFRYGSSRAYLRLIDANGNSRIPAITEGKLGQYLISFASAVATISSLGLHNIYIDEAFGVSSENNLPKIGDLLRKYVDSGMQFIIIAQNNDLYKAIPRREFRLRKDLPEDSSQQFLGHVVVESIIDY